MIYYKNIIKNIVNIAFLIIILYQLDGREKKRVDLVLFHFLPKSLVLEHRGRQIERKRKKILFCF